MQKKQKDKKIIDFTNKSAEEIYAVLHAIIQLKNKFSQCGCPLKIAKTKTRKNISVR